MERTSSSVASKAARLLNRKRLADVEDWLELVKHGGSVPKGNASGYATILLDLIGEMRSVAASALTQKE